MRPRPFHWPAPWYMRVGRLLRQNKTALYNIQNLTKPATIPIGADYTNRVTVPTYPVLLFLKLSPSLRPHKNCESRFICVSFTTTWYILLDPIMGGYDVFISFYSRFKCQCENKTNAKGIEENKKLNSCVKRVSCLLRFHCSCRYRLVPLK